MVKLDIKWYLSSKVPIVGLRDGAAIPPKLEPTLKSEKEFGEWCYYFNSRWGSKAEIKKKGGNDIIFIDCCAADFTAPHGTIITKIEDLKDLISGKTTVVPEWTAEETEAFARRGIRRPSVKTGEDTSDDGEDDEFEEEDEKDEDCEEEEDEEDDEKPSSGSSTAAAIKTLKRVAKLAEELSEALKSLSSDLGTPLDSSRFRD